MGKPITPVDTLEENKDLLIANQNSKIKSLETQLDALKFEYSKVLNVLDRQNRAFLITDLKERTVLTEEQLRSMETEDLVKMRESTKYVKMPTTIAGIRGADTKTFDSRLTVPNMFKFGKK